MSSATNLHWIFLFSFTYHTVWQSDTDVLDDSPSLSPSAALPCSLPSRHFTVLPHLCSSPASPVTLHHFSGSLTLISFHAFFHASTLHFHSQIQPKLHLITSASSTKQNKTKKCRNIRKAERFKQLLFISLYFLISNMLIWKMKFIAGKVIMTQQYQWWWIIFLR